MPPFTINPEDLWPIIFRLANENDRSYRFTKKGDKRTREDVEAQKAGRKRTIAAKQAVAIERTLAAARQRNLRRAGQAGSIPERMLRVMKPGSWYGMGDLARLAGVSREGRGKVHQVMLRRGWIERQPNAAATGDRLDPWAIMGGAEPEPEWLYRLTPFGEAAQKGLPRR